MPTNRFDIADHLEHRWRPSKLHAIISRWSDLGHLCVRCRTRAKSVLAYSAKARTTLTIGGAHTNLIYSSSVPIRGWCSGWNDRSQRRRRADVRSLADLLEIEGANPFRVRAYRDAARVVGDLPHDISALVAAGKNLSELHGIGTDLAGKIEEIVET